MWDLKVKKVKGNKLNSLHMKHDHSQADAEL